ncbi:MAG: hypothetical protein R3264_06790 [Anaerolineae bacterium]|nr:hypothetical protein [Anaerolineae bacterium]
MSLTPPYEQPVVVDLHGATIAFQADDRALRERFSLIYGHLPDGQSKRPDILITWHLTNEANAPLPDPKLPVIHHDNLVNYYGAGDRITMRMPKYATITVDLARQNLIGTVTPNCLNVYGVFEDVVMISLAPIYRRRRWYPLHAFAAMAPTGEVILISGQMGSGKTTTGLALLDAGWKLLSNDSPLLTLQNDIVYGLAYPGQLSAFDDSLARFESLKRFIPAVSAPDDRSDNGSRREKRVFRAEEAFADPWVDSGVIGAVFFPQVTPGLDHSEVSLVSAKDAMLALVPQGVEGWDKATIGQSFHILAKLVEQVPCYQLKLAPDVNRLPDIIRRGLRP